MSFKASEVGKIYETDKYAQFKRLLGNREIADSRVKRIRESIETNGWITNPIVVNEKLEIIDGQGRWSALRELGMPVQFVVHDGATVDDCIALNLRQKNWTMADYARSYAEQGYPDYIRLCNFANSTGISIPFASAILNESISDGSHYSSSLSMGKYKVTQQRCDDIKANLDFLRMSIDKVKKLHGHRLRITVPCTLFCYMYKGSNRARVWDVVENSLDLVPPLNTVAGILDAISEIYNKSLPKKSRIAFDALYKLKRMEAENGN